MWTWLSDNTSIHYVSDIEAIPGYQTDKIVYQTYKYLSIKIKKGDSNINKKKGRKA